MTAPPGHGTRRPVATATATADPFLGRVIAGQFRVERLLGVGAMARVYLAQQLGLERPVALKILHRELLPDNVMLVRRGADSDFVKVLDFGMARAGRDPDFATRDGAVLGTARYIAPEGAQGGSVGPEADVYAIATLLFQCIAGRTPFDGQSAVAILVQQVSAKPPDLRGVGAGRDAPQALAELVARNLAKDPLDRAANARALGAELSAGMFAGRQDTSITARLLGGRQP